MHRAFLGNTTRVELYNKDKAKVECCELSEGCGSSGLGGNSRRGEKNA